MDKDINGDFKLMALVNNLLSDYEIEYSRKKKFLNYLFDQIYKVGFHKPIELDIIKENLDIWVRDYELKFSKIENQYVFVNRGTISDEQIINEQVD
jgi:hypothetical protein